MTSFPTILQLCMLCIYGDTLKFISILTLNSYNCDYPFLRVGCRWTNFGLYDVSTKQPQSCLCGWLERIYLKIKKHFMKETPQLQQDWKKVLRKWISKSYIRFMYHMKMNAHTHVAAKDRSRAKERREWKCVCVLCFTSLQVLHFIN